MAMLVAVTMTVGFVYAEEVDVPIDWTKHGCSTSVTDGEITYSCFWSGSQISPNATIPADFATAKFEVVDEETDSQNIGFEDLIEVKLTPAEIYLERLIEKKEKGTISTADKELLRLLQATTRACELGIEHGERLQNYARFQLPDIDPRIDTATDYLKNNQLGKIVKKFEECTAWNEYRFDMLGPQYLHMEVDDSTSQAHHREMVQSLETYPVPRLNDHDFAEADKQAKEWICNASLYDRHFKSVQGCFDDVVLEERNISNPLDRNPAYTNYKEYMSTGYVDLQSLKDREVEKAHVQSLESFALQHGIDVAELKNLIQPVDEYNKQKIQEGQKP